MVRPYKNGGQWLGSNEIRYLGALGGIECIMYFKIFLARNDKFFLIENIESKTSPPTQKGN